MCHSSITFFYFMQHFKKGDLVMMKNARKEGRKGGKMEPPWSGPYEIYDVHESGLYTLKNKHGKLLKKKIHSVLLKQFQNRSGAYLMFRSFL